MKKSLLVLGLAILTGIVVYQLSYTWTLAEQKPAMGTDAELAWLGREFSLSPVQFEKVSALHVAYTPICAAHCTNYIAAHRRLTALLQSRTAWSPEVGTAIAEQARIQAECHGAMLKYAYEVAACMSPAESARYLEMIKRQLTDGDPAGMFASAR